jgi:nicotinate-nucleotide pyrophosphorylase (carboxylating)
MPVTDLKSARTALGLTADEIGRQVRLALDEDIGSGDVTAALLDENETAGARILCRESATLCGIPWVESVFEQLDPRVQIDWHCDDGTDVAPGQTVCQIEGPVRSLLTGERTALNFLQTLSGTASVTRRYVAAVAGTPARILDTRKTLPGLRLAQKYAVLCGGGHNHRIGLHDMVLIKENHIAAAGSVGEALAAATALAVNLPVEIEVESLAQLDDALAAGAQRILLDNMDLSHLRQAVERSSGRAQLEASGNVTLENIKEIATTGVDFISVGSLTKHLRAVDFSMRLITG